jgi:hypothetical protein
VRIVLIAVGLGALALAGCGRAGQPVLANGKKPPTVRPPNSIAVVKPERPYGDKWDYPRRRGVFQIDPPPAQPKTPTRSFLLDPLL